MKLLWLCVLALVVINSSADETETWVVCNQNGKSMKKVDVLSIEEYTTRTTTGLWDVIDNQVVKYVNMTVGDNFFPTCIADFVDENCTVEFPYVVDCQQIIPEQTCEECFGINDGQKTCFGSQEYHILFMLNTTVLSDCDCDVFQRVRGRTIKGVDGSEIKCELPWDSSGLVTEEVELEREKTEIELCGLLVDQLERHRCGLSVQPDTYVDDNLHEIINFTMEHFYVSSLELDVAGYSFETGVVTLGPNTPSSPDTFPRYVNFILKFGGEEVNRFRVYNTQFNFQIPVDKISKHSVYTWELETDSFNWFGSYHLKNGTFMWNSAKILPQIQIFDTTGKLKLEECEGVIGDGVIFCKDDDLNLEYISFDTTIMYFSIVLIVYITLGAGVCITKQMSKGIPLKVILFSILAVNTNAFCFDSSAIVPIIASAPIIKDGISNFQINKYKIDLLGDKSSICMHVMDDKNDQTLYSVEFVLDELYKEYQLESLYSTFTVKSIHTKSETLGVPKEAPNEWISPKKQEIRYGVPQIQGWDCKELNGCGRNCFECKRFVIDPKVDPVGKQCWLDVNAGNKVKDYFTYNGKTFYSTITNGKRVTLLYVNSVCSYEKGHPPSFDYGPSDIKELQGQYLTNFFNDRLPHIYYSTRFKDRVTILCDTTKADGRFISNTGSKAAFVRGCTEGGNDAIYTLKTFEPENFYNVYEVRKNNVDAVAKITINVKYANGTTLKETKEQRLSEMSSGKIFFQQGDFKAGFAGIAQLLGALPERDYIFQGVKYVDKHGKTQSKDIRNYYIKDVQDINDRNSFKPGVIMCDFKTLDRCSVRNTDGHFLDSGGKDDIFGKDVWIDEPNTNNKFNVRELGVERDITLTINNQNVPSKAKSIVTKNGDNLSTLRVYSSIGGVVSFNIESSAQLGVFKKDVTVGCSLDDSLVASADGFLLNEKGWSLNVLLISKDNPGQIAISVVRDGTKPFDPNMRVDQTRYQLSTTETKLRLTGSTTQVENHFKVVFKSHSSQCEVSSSFKAEIVNNVPTPQPINVVTGIPTPSPTVKATKQTEHTFQTVVVEEEGPNMVLIGVSVGVGVIFGLPLLLTICSTFLSDEDE